MFAAFLICGGVLNFWRLVRWRGIATLAEPLLAVMHLGYAWLAISATLLGIAALDPRFPQSAAVHALTAGAIGTMTLAVMTRATRGHTGRALAADHVTVAVYAFVNLAAVARVLAAFADSGALPLLIAAAALWVAAFGLFTIAYAPMLLRARRSDER